MPKQVRSIKIGAKVQIRPASFPLTGLPAAASGVLNVDEYGEPWQGRYTLEVLDAYGNRYNVLETELIVIED